MHPKLTCAGWRIILHHPPRFPAHPVWAPFPASLLEEFGSVDSSGRQWHQDEDGPESITTDSPSLEAQPESVGVNGSDAQRMPSDSSPTDESGAPEGRFLAGPGEPLFRHVTELNAKVADARARAVEAKSALDDATAEASRRQRDHRGGARTWLLRTAVPVAIAIEALTAYIAMEALVPTVLLAVGLAIFTAAVGAGLACIVANRRLDRLPVPLWTRLLEVAFVLLLTLLRFYSLWLQPGSGPLEAVGGALLAGLVSAVGLFAIEEVVVESDTFRVFVARLQLRWRRWREARARRRPARLQAKFEGAVEKLRQHFLSYLLKHEQYGLTAAQDRCNRFKNAISS